MPFFESAEKLAPEHVDLERARKSLREELEAIDYYQERIDATEDPSLKALLEHNMDEEKEHAAMLIEWIRKHDATQNRLFNEHDKIGDRSIHTHGGVHEHHEHRAIDREP